MAIQYYRDQNILNEAVLIFASNTLQEMNGDKMDNVWGNVYIQI